MLANLSWRVKEQLRDLSFLLIFALAILAQGQMIIGPRLELVQFPPMPLALQPNAATYTYTGPLDVIGLTNAPACYSLWACSRTYIGGSHVSIRAKRSSDSQLCDVAFSSGGYIGLTANCSGSANGSVLSTFCASGGGSCIMTIWYDQKGNSANNLVAQTGGGTYFTAGATLIFNEYGTLLGLDFGTDLYAEYQTTGFTSTGSQPWSISTMVSLATAGVGAQPQQWFAGFGSCCGGLGFNSAGQVLMNAGSSTQTALISTTALHNVLATFNDYSSMTNVDGSLTNAITTPGTGGLNAKFTVGAGDGYNYPAYVYTMELIVISTNLATGSGGAQALLCANQATRNGNFATCAD